MYGDLRASERTRRVNERWTATTITKQKKRKKLIRFGHNTVIFWSNSKLMSVFRYFLVRLGCALCWFVCASVRVCTCSWNRIDQIYSYFVSRSRIRQSALIDKSVYKFIVIKFNRFGCTRVFVCAFVFDDRCMPSCGMNHVWAHHRSDSMPIFVLVCMHTTCVQATSEPIEINGNGAHLFVVRCICAFLVIFRYCF